jgi:hypothetical protein
MARRHAYPFLGAVLLACGGARNQPEMQAAAPTDGGAVVGADAAAPPPGVLAPASAREACYGVEVARAVRSCEPLDGGPASGYLCAGGRDVDLGFARVHRYAEQHRWAEAAALAEDVANDDPAAGLLCLEWVNLLLRARPVCRDAAAELVVKLGARWCGDAGRSVVAADAGGRHCRCGDPLCVEDFDAGPCPDDNGAADELCGTLERIAADLARTP